MLRSDVEHEIRTTGHPDLLGTESFEALVDAISAVGVRHYIIPECVTNRYFGE